MYRFSIRRMTQFGAPVGSDEIDQGKQPSADPALIARSRAQDVRSLARCR